MALVGVADTVQMLRTKLRLDSTAMQVNQVVSQCNTISAPGDTAQFWQQAQDLLGSTVDVLGTAPATVPDGTIIVSAVYNDRGVNRVAWQVRSGTGGHASAFGGAGGTAALPAGFAVPGDHTLVVTEIFAPTKAWALSGKLMGGKQDRLLGATTMLISRALDPARLRQPPSASTAMACTA